MENGFVVQLYDAEVWVLTHLGTFQIFASSLIIFGWFIMNLGGFWGLENIKPILQHCFNNGLRSIVFLFFFF